MQFLAPARYLTLIHPKSVPHCFICERRVHANLAVLIQTWLLQILEIGFHWLECLIGQTDLESLIAHKLLFLDQKWRWQWWWWWWRGRILVWRFEMRNLIWPPSLAGGDSRGGAPALDNGGIHSLHRLRHRPIIEQLGWTTDLWAAALPTFAGWQKVKRGNQVPSFLN